MGSEPPRLGRIAGGLPAVARIEALHSYDAPAIVGWEADLCGEATGDWLAALRDAAR